MSEEPKIEVIEPEAPATVIGEEKPTRDALRDEGWSQEELDAAEKHGMVKTTAKPEKVASVDKKEGNEAPEAKPQPQKRTTPEYSLDAEQEKKFFETFGPGSQPRGLYVGMKIEREKRQKLEAEIERMKRERTPEKVEPKLEVLPTKDANGNVVDPDDQPLTPKRLRELAKQEAEARQKQEEERQSTYRALGEAHQTHEEVARTLYPDFDDTVKLATDLIKNIETMGLEPKQKARAVVLYREFMESAAKAHTLSSEDFNEADLAYELGKLHPNYGKKGSDGDEPTVTDDNPPEVEPKKATGSQTPEKLKRIEANTQRRTSSAAVPSAGRRTVTADEVTLDHLLKMSPEKFEEFRQKHPDQYAKLQRG